MTSAIQNTDESVFKQTRLESHNRTNANGEVPMNQRPRIQAYAGDEYDEARTNRYTKKAPAATGAINTETPTKRKESMHTSIPHAADNFDATFILNVGISRVWVVPATLQNGESIIELTDDGGSNLLMKPGEALAVAASIQAVATHILEEESRVLIRRTEPGQPEFNGIGGGL